MLSSDPHAWLYALFARLNRDRTFGHLSPSHQFEILRTAVAVEHPAKAAAMMEWSPAAKDGLLLHLANATHESQPPLSSELWRVRKGERELRCVTRYLPSGIDVCLFEGDDFRRTHLCRDAPAVETLTAEWKTKLLEVGWTVLTTSPRT